MPKRRKKSPRYWSARVTETSRRMDLPHGTFEKSPKVIARALKRAVNEAGKGRSKTKYAAAMSMLNFYINRAGRNLSKAALNRLERAKVELRRLFGKTQTATAGLGDFMLFDAVTDQILEDEI